MNIYIISSSKGECYLCAKPVFRLAWMELKDTGFGYTLSLIGGKYKMIILYWLSENKVVRFNELKRCIGIISFKTLSLMLKELEADGLILRKEFPQVPPKVEYSLSERGHSLIPLLNMMCEWGDKNSSAALEAIQR